MRGQFRLYAVGKTEAKSGKINYQFIYGNKPENEPNGLLEDCDVVNWWTDEKYDLKFMEPVNAVIDIKGEMKMVISIHKFKQNLNG